jgi:hypothetical protein
MANRLGTNMEQPVVDSMTELEPQTDLPPTEYSDHCADAHVASAADCLRGICSARRAILAR